MKNVFGLVGLGGKTVLPALFACTAACLLSVSSAQASVIADWANGTLQALPTGVQSATPASFTATTTGTASTTFTVTLASGYTASGMAGLFSIVVSGGTGGHTVTITINGTSTSYGNGTFNNIAVTPNSGSISAGGSDNFLVNLSANAHGMTVNFTDVQFDGALTSPVPEPITYAMAVFGLMFVGGSAGRFYLGRRRLATVR